MGASRQKGGNGTATSTALPDLLPRHLDDLRKSGLTDETIAACGFRSLQAPQRIQQVLRWQRYKGELGDCLLIPFPDANGKPTGYARLKPDRPRKGREDGKPIKYESPKGVSNLPFFPPGTLAALQDATVSLLITEGEKKAAKADQDGFPCIGLVGVWGGQKRRTKGPDGKTQGERELIPGLEAVPWKGRTVSICFDSDAATNPHVRAAEWHLAEVLTRHGAKVLVVRIPPGEAGPDGQPKKVGLDDHLVGQGPDAFRKLLATATPPEPPPAGLQPREADDDPHRLARLFVREAGAHADGLTLRSWREEWHRWDSSAYRIVPEKELRAELTASVKREMDRLNLVAQKIAAREGENPPFVRKVTGRLIADRANALTSLTVLPGKVEAPTWIGGDGPFAADEVLACRNQLVHLPSLVEGRPYSHPHTPRFFSPNVLTYDFNRFAPRPCQWLEFVNMLWPKEEEKDCISTLAEWFGYSLLPDTRQQKILLLVGPKRSGKGTIARVLRALVGIENTAGPTLASPGSNFGLQPLLGKLLAIVSDARLSGRTDAAVVAERLLSISGEDPQTVDRKHLTALTLKLPTRIVILTNELPRLSDASGALAGRMILLRLRESWYGREDVHLTDKLLAELPAILLWAIDGWKRLRERGHFVQPKSGKTLLSDLEDLSSPISAFIRECCETGPGYEVPVQDLFQRWQTWCEGVGKKEAGTKGLFGRDLRAALPHLDMRQPRAGDTRTRVYVGIRVKNDFIPE
jgi:putative DNA primase/helicase